MRLEVQKYLYDIKQAADLVLEFTEGRNFFDYETNAMLRSAVERQLEVIGEAVVQLARLDAGLAGRITEHRRIIAFRNILIHQYRQVDNRLVWDTVESKLPALRDEVAALLLVDHDRP
jgi:uncharacterized protein with HEPN domain